MNRMGEMAAPTETISRATIGVRIRQSDAAAPLRKYGLVRTYSAALLIIGAAAIHFAAAAEHMPIYVPWGIFFICLGIAQISVAAAVVAAPSARLLVGAAIGTAGVIGLWLVSRTVGVPIAPEPWRPEPVGLLDVSASVLETISIVLLLLLMRSPQSQKSWGPIRIGLTTVPAGLAAAIAACLAAGSALNSMPVAFSAAPEVAGQTTTSVASLVAAPGGEPIDTFTLTAAVTKIDGRDAWAYNGTVPGPELRVTEGDRVRVELVNHLPDATSIHWHGIDVPNAMDGVAGITENATPPGGTFTYEFIAKDAGTYWYHSHQDANHQVPRGLYGAIVVLPKTASAASLRDYTLILHTQPGGDAVEANGAMNLHLPASPGDTVRLRVVNVVVPPMDGAPIYPILIGAPYQVVALDGHDINGPQWLGPERIPLDMGQRADLVFTMPGTGAVRLDIGKVPAFLPWEKPATANVTIGTGTVPSVNLSSVPTFDLTSYGAPAADPVADAPRYDVTRDMVLDVLFQFHNGMLDVSNNFDGMPAPFEPPLRVREGQLVLLHIFNNSVHFHPIHIHGHVFSIVAKNGRHLSGSPIHVDTVLIGPHETWDIAFKADNPGIWMLHCHALVHAASGMSMTINYEGIYTPFTMGSRSGNVPE